MFKVLVIRFSSIGDIVLTSPVVRALKQQKKAEVHFVCKTGFSSMLSANPNIDKIWSWNDEEKKTILDQLQAVNFNLIVDLHKNLRSTIIRNRLKVKTISFDKLNVEKWLMTTFKWDRLPRTHIVDRYFETIKKIGLSPDQDGLDYFIPKDTPSIESLLPDQIVPKAYTCLVLGAAHFTKQIPFEKLKEICQNSTAPVLLLGGKKEIELAKNLVDLELDQVFNYVGKTSLHESARIIQHTQLLITPDTGMMHIGAALNVPKIGKNQCPKGHFKCMNEIDTQLIVKASHDLT